MLAIRDLTLEKSFADLKLSLLLNSALAALKTSTPLKAEDARLAIKQTTRALGMDGDEIKNPGLKVLTDGEKAKGLYRRAVAYGVVKEDEKSIADLEQALKYVPGDAAISKECVLFLSSDWSQLMTLRQAASGEEESHGCQGAETQSVREDVCLDY